MFKTVLAALHAAVQFFALDVDSHQREARDAYLAQSQTLAELEHRQREWERSHAQQSLGLPHPHY